EDVFADEVGDAGSAVNDAAGHRVALEGSASVGVIVHRPGVVEAVEIAGRSGFRAVDVALAPGPAVVASVDDEIHLLACVLADIGAPEFPGRGVEAHPPRVPQA